MTLPDLRLLKTRYKSTKDNKYPIARGKCHNLCWNPKIVARVKAIAAKGTRQTVHFSDSRGSTEMLAGMESLRLFLEKILLDAQAPWERTKLSENAAQMRCNSPWDTKRDKA